MDLIPYLKEVFAKIEVYLQHVKSADDEAFPLAWSEFATASHWYLKIEEDYLLPEISGLYRSSAMAEARMTADYQEFSEMLASVQQDIAGVATLAEVRAKVLPCLEIVASHLGFLDREVLPKLRQFMPTEIREDLSQVLEDALEDGPGFAVREDVVSEAATGS